MSKLDDAIVKFEANLGKLGVKVDSVVLRGVAKSLGPSLYKNDAAKVAASDKKELETIKKNFLIKKLGLKDTPKLDAGISAVIEKVGKSNPNKQRAVFYYLLVKHFKKSGLFK